MLGGSSSSSSSRGAAAASSPRAIFVVAHRINGSAALAALPAETRALECDVRADADGRWVVDHDGAFPWSRSIERHARDVGALPRALDVLVLDVKTPRAAVQRVVDVFDAALAPRTVLVVCGDTLDDVRALRRDGALRAPSSGRRMLVGAVGGHRGIDVARAVFDERPPIDWFGIGIASVWPARASYVAAVARAVADAPPHVRVVAWTLGTLDDVRDALAAGASVLIVVPHLVAAVDALIAATATLRAASVADVA